MFDVTRFIEFAIEYFFEIAMAILVALVIWDGFQWLGQRMDARWDCLIAEVRNV